MACLPLYATFIKLHGVSTHDDFEKLHGVSTHDGFTNFENEFYKIQDKIGFMQIAQPPPAKNHVDSCSTKQPPYKCHLPVHQCTDPHLWGCIFKRAGYFEEE